MKDTKGELKKSMNKIVCPTVTAYTMEEYNRQIHDIARYSHRVHIDLTDGKFTKEATVKPEEAWWPVGVHADFHLMYKNPQDVLDHILPHRPNMVIIHAEAEGKFKQFAVKCHSHSVAVGVALLADSEPDIIAPALDDIDHVLIFSGNLGYQGGSHADLKLLEKIYFLKSLKPSLEIGWDGGINDQNIADLAAGDVDIFNVGGYLQHAENPPGAYSHLMRLLGN